MLWMSMWAVAPVQPQEMKEKLTTLTITTENVCIYPSICSSVVSDFSLLARLVGHRTTHHVTGRTHRCDASNAIRVSGYWSVWCASLNSPVWIQSESRRISNVVTWFSPWFRGLNAALMQLLAASQLLYPHPLLLFLVTRLVIDLTCLPKLISRRTFNQMGWHIIYAAANTRS